MTERGTGGSKEFAESDKSREPFRLVPVEADILQRRGTPGPQPGPRFTDEERRRVAQFFILLDEIDRAHARRERKAA